MYASVVVCVNMMYMECGVYAWCTDDTHSLMIHTL